MGGKVIQREQLQGQIIQEYVMYLVSNGKSQRLVMAETKYHAVELALYLYGMYSEESKREKYKVKKVTR